MGLNLVDVAPRTSLVATFMVTHDVGEDHLLWSGSRLFELATRARPSTSPTFGPVESHHGEPMDAD
jgi:hypothetical protein